MLSVRLASLTSLLFAFPAASPALTAKQIYERTKDSVVSIDVQTAKGRASGTGFFYVDGRTVATALHVVEGATKIEIRGRNGRVWKPVSVRINSSADTALLILGANSGRRAIPHAPSTSIGVGDPIYVIGDPLGLTGSLSTGVVGAFRNSRGVPLIQFTASISEGSSGSPVLDKQGRAVGVVSFTYSDGQNLNMAIASKVAKVLKDSGISFPVQALSSLSKSTDAASSDPIKQAAARTKLSVLSGLAYGNYYRCFGLWDWFLSETYLDDPASKKNQEVLEAALERFKRPLTREDQLRLTTAVSEGGLEAEEIELLANQLQKLHDAADSLYRSQIALGAASHKGKKALDLAIAEMDRRRSILVDLLYDLDDWFTEQDWCDENAYSDAVPPIVQADWFLLGNFHAQVQFRMGIAFEIGHASADSPLEPGDVIVGLGLDSDSTFEPISSWTALVKFSEAHPLQDPFKIQVRREGKILTFTGFKLPNGLPEFPPTPPAAAQSR